MDWDLSGWSVTVVRRTGIFDLALYSYAEFRETPPDWSSALARRFRQPPYDGGVGGPSAVTIRFYAELNDHLPPEWRQRDIERPLVVPGSVKDVIESCGVPHTEVELILVNGASVDFSYVVRDGDRIAVYPVFEAVDVAPVLRVRPAPLRDPRFVLDVHLGRLAAYLRMVGFDTMYRSCFEDADLVRVSVAERRILLTRDRGLLKHGALTHGYWLRETDSRRQLSEIVRRFELKRLMRPFTRCMACNGMLADVAKVEVARNLPARVAQTFDEFRRCSYCRRVYWKGSHYRRMEHWLGTLTGDPDPRPSVGEDE